MSRRGGREVNGTRALRRAVWMSTGWVAVFTAFHVYWFLGGRFGFGDMSDPLPPLEDAGDVAFAAVIGAAFVVGAVLPLGFVHEWGDLVPFRARLAAAWFGSLLLVARGVLGLVDTALRELGLAELGLTGLTYEQITGDAHPTAYTLWSGSAIDAWFALGGVLFGVLARRARRVRQGDRAGPGISRGPAARRR